MSAIFEEIPPKGELRKHRDAVHFPEEKICPFCDKPFKIRFLNSMLKCFNALPSGSSVISISKRSIECRPRDKNKRTNTYIFVVIETPYELLRCFAWLYKFKVYWKEFALG